MVYLAVSCYKRQVLLLCSRLIRQNILFHRLLPCSFVLISGFQFFWILSWLCARYTMFDGIHFVFPIPFFAVISELIHYTAARNSGGVSSQLPLIQVIVPQVMNLKPQLRDPSKVYTLCIEQRSSDWFILFFFSQNYKK